MSSCATAQSPVHRERRGADADDDSDRSESANNNNAAEMESERVSDERNCCSKQEEQDAMVADPAMPLHSKDELHESDDRCSELDANAAAQSHTDNEALQLEKDPQAVLASVSESSAHPGYGIECGTLELVAVVRKQWTHPQEPPLPLTSPTHAPLLREFTRPWRALRLRPALSDARSKLELLPPHQALLKSYEPRFSVGEHTFPSEITPPSFLDARVAIEDSHAFVVTVHLRFALGAVRRSLCDLTRGAVVVSRSRARLY